MSETGKEPAKKIPNESKPPIRRKLTVEEKEYNRKVRKYNREKLKAKKNREKWESSFSVLPESAGQAKELIWIRNHPAMFRKDRQTPEEKGNSIKLLASDITNAPSKAAVIQLQHWVNNPAEFQKQVLTGQKKIGAIEEAGDEIVTPEILEIDRLLESLDCALDPKLEGVPAVDFDESQLFQQ